MTRVDGPSHRWLFARVDALDVAMSLALHVVVNKLVPHLTMNAVTAAGDEPPPDEFFTPPTTYMVPIDWQGLSIIQSLWLEQVAYNLLPQIYSAYEDAAVEQYGNIIISVPDVEDALAPVTSSGAEEYLAQARNRMVGVGDKLWTTIRNELQAGVDKGESIDELKARLVASAGISEPRARTVARTEVISAANAGSFDQARLGAEVGLVMQKEWLATEDFRTRPTHHAADGQKVGLEDSFTVGGSSLMFPGDPSGPADEIINCRCTITYEVEDDEPLAINASGGPRMSTGAPWKWDGLAHAEFCKSPLHPGPCKGAHPSIAKKYQGPKKKFTKKAAPVKHAAKHAAPAHAGGGGGGAPAESSGLTSHDALAKSMESAAAATPSTHKSGLDGLSHAEKMKVYTDFKGHKGVSPAYSGKAIYESMQHAKSANSQHNLSDADVLSIIDEQGTSMGHTAKAGPTAYTDKVHAWLGTPAGKKVAAAHLQSSQGHIPHEPKPQLDTEQPHVPSHSEALKNAGSSHGPGALMGDDIAASSIPPNASNEEAYKHFAKLADKHGISPAEAGSLYDLSHNTSLAPGAAAHAKKFGLDEGHPLPTQEDFKADISHLNANQLKTIHDDFKSEFYSHTDEPDDAVLLASEAAAQKHGLSPLQVTKAVDAHIEAKGGHANYTNALLAHAGLEPPPPPAVPKPKKVSVPKKKKLSAEELPKPSELTGYKALPEDVKLDLGDSGIDHIPFEKRAEIVNDAKKFGVSYYTGEELHTATAKVAELHGVSKLQVAQIYDKYADGKKKSWEKKTPNLTEKNLYKGAKLGAASKDPLSTDGITPGKMAQLGSSDIHDIPAIQKQTIVDAAATQYISPYHDDKTVFSTTQKLGSHLGFSPHQVAKILDEAAAGKSGTNTHTYEQKILKLAKTGTLPKAQKVYGSALAHGGYHLVEPPKNVTAPAGTHHTAISPGEAAQMQKQMLAQHGAWTSAQEGALSTYTSSYYKHMNGYLRSGGTVGSSAGVKQKVQQLQSAMKPIPRDIIVHRGADHLGFGLKSANDIPSLVGKTYEDRGFLSTSVGGSAAFGGSVRLTIHAPKGTHAAYVGHGMTTSKGTAISHFGHENEVILAAGTKYKVISAVKGGTQYASHWDVVVEVVS